MQLEIRTHESGRRQSHILWRTPFCSYRSMPCLWWQGIGTLNRPKAAGMPSISFEGKQDWDHSCGRRVVKAEGLAMDGQGQETAEFSLLAPAELVLKQRWESSCSNPTCPTRETPGHLV